MEEKSVEIYVITGPSGVGKSTISAMLARELDNSALVQGDQIYLMVVGGFIAPWEDDGTYMNLFWENVLALTENFVRRHISVILEYVIYPEQTNALIKKFGEKNIPIKYVMLMADEETIRKRDGSRNSNEREGERAVQLLKKFKEMNIGDKYVINTSNMSREEIIKEILTDKRFLL